MTYETGTTYETYEVTADQVHIPRSDSSAPMAAYVARPVDHPGTTPRPAVLIGAELWGLTDQVRAVTRDVAALGYVAVAPDLYHRAGQDTGNGFAESDENSARAFDLVSRLTRDGVESDLRAALAHAATHAGAHADKAGMLGFSLGGHVTYFAATRLPLAAAALYYPGWLTEPGTALSRPDALLSGTYAIAGHDTRVRMFFAELDHVIDAGQREETAAALTASGVRHDITVYPGAQHAFFVPGRPAYAKAAAEDSWGRVAALFAEELG
ncbi:dienelactone hydrolase family protein [Actinomycetota bacterium Odt1-20B]